MEPKRAKIALIGNSTNFVLISDVRDQNETPLRLMLRQIYQCAICIHVFKLADWTQRGNKVQTKNLHISKKNE